MAVDCGCLYIQWSVGSHPDSGDFNPSGEYNGFSYYEFSIFGVPHFLYYYPINDEWLVSLTLGGAYVDALAIYTPNVAHACPLGDGNWVSTGLFAYEMLTTNCGNDEINCCFDLIMIRLGITTEMSLSVSNAQGLINGQLSWTWCIDDTGYQLFSEADEIGGCTWKLNSGKCFSAIPNGTTIWRLRQDPCACPISQIWNAVQGGDVSYFATAPCEVPICIPMEDRHYRKYESIKLPQLFVEQDRGFKICCDCPMLVLGGGSETWENDVTSAWIKLALPSDSATFLLKKDGVITNYVPEVLEFPNEENAFYTTIPWSDVLSSDGIGCYTLSIEYNISGIIGELMWGQYNLKPYSISNALETARIRVKYNLQQEIEGINFTGANVEDCIRFNGFIGDRQPNMEIDNLIYQDRSVKTVVRENLDSFTIKTDPLMECFVGPMCNLFLLSENEMWISDYNAHNHSYRINDIPVVVEETPEIDYLDQFQRRAILTCKVGLRTKNRRTYY